ncbi:MAG: chromosome segregation protein SMC [Myxococcales bacterium]|nr:chromosome segregation protein SMC [Myxococcales bacterium]
MRLKSLELNGFKSFVDKTAIRFQPGINGVVGPNGCGKSNVVDAMRWVMGEQSPRRLRGKGMEDVIFAGSEGRSSVGMAEVVLSFDNSDGSAPPAYAAFSEIQICRRLYRSGESEYLLNKAPCRLRDVQDFFRDTGVGTKGYTIVEQGRIAEIVSAKAEERRTLIEEAAGIGKYKARRREAESKMASTEQNLLRVNDVLTEIRRQISSIERQARKAARYKRLRETQRVLELSVASDERGELAQVLEESRKGLQVLRDEVAALDARNGERELALQEQRLELSECERVLTQGSEEMLGLRTRIKDCEGHIEYGQREQEGLAQLVVARRGELAELREQRAGQERERAEVEAEFEGVEQAVLSGETALEVAETSAREAREQRAGLEAEREVANSALVEALTEIARGEDRLAAVADRRQQLELRLRGADEGLEIGQSESSRVDHEQQTLEEGLRNLLAERDRLMGGVRDALEANERALETEQAVAESLRTARESLEGRRARFESIQEVLESREDVAEGARYLLGGDAATRRRLGVRGLLRELIEVDPEAESAVEAVLADRAGALVVESPESALSALEVLRSQNAGRAVLVTTAPAEPGVRGVVPLGAPLLDCVRARAGCEDLVQSLFAGVQLVEDLREVVSVYGRGRMPATFVTRQGDLLAPDGLLRGGSGGETGPLMRVRELRSLEALVEELEAQVAEQARRHEAAVAERSRAHDELENLRNRHHTAALAVANHEKDLERTRERMKALGEAQEGRTQERSELQAEVDELFQESDRLQGSTEAAGAHRSALQRELDGLGLRIGTLGRELERLETVATERRVEHAGRAEHRDRLQASCEKAVAALSETGSWIQRREEEIRDAETRSAELSTSIEEARASLQAGLREEENARMGHDEKRDAFERVSAEVGQLDEGLRDLRGEISGARERLGANELQLRESEMKLEHLDQTVREKWDVNLEAWRPPSFEEEAENGAAAPAGASEAAVDSAEGEDAPPDEAREARANAEAAQLPLEERRVKLEEVRKKMSTLGDVNLGAIEEHEELGERMRFLAEQKADLESTLASLRDAIARINRTSRKRFRETFEQVSQRFSENFPRLFQGGRASLSLTESEDVLDAGIEIMAMPPGKRLQNVNLLSGGEKTLTAIALLVAVFQVRPSPFFLLDEVDAALDDANVGRFNEIVRELAATSQFVLITHNKRTIEVADVLYGVTMERKGVSKMVAVEMH